MELYFMTSTWTLDSFSLLLCHLWPLFSRSPLGPGSLLQMQGSSPYFNQQEGGKRHSESKGSCELFLQEGSLKLLQYVLFLIFTGQNLFSLPQGRLGNCLYLGNSCAQLESLMVKWILGGNSSFCHTLFEPWCLWEHPSCKNTIINISPNNIDLSRPYILLQRHNKG